MILRTILLVGLMSILAGCPKPETVKPTKPTLEIRAQPDGGMCLDRRNTEALGAYIQQLEAQP